VLTEGYAKRHISLEKLVGKMTANPARAYGLYPKKGTMRVGADADVTVVDLENGRKVRAADSYGSSDFSLIEGRELIGWPRYVVKGGDLAYARGEVLLKPGAGKVLSPTRAEV
jgi:dihydropyrimidinase